MLELERVRAEQDAPPALPRCANCETLLAPPGRWCPGCGQKVPRARLALRDLGVDSWMLVTGIDRSVLSLARGLIVRPGGVARDWIQGRRRRYFSPLSFVAWMVGLAVATMIAVNFHPFEARDEDSVASVVFLTAKVNLLQLVQVPLLAAWGLLLFGWRRRSFAEQLVLGAYATGARVGVGALLLLAVHVVYGGSEAHPDIARAYLALWIAYFAWASSHFHEGRRAVSALKGAAVALLAQATTNLVITRGFGVKFVLAPEW